VSGSKTGLERLREKIREWSEEIGPITPRMERDPGALEEFCDAAVFRYQAQLAIPPEYRVSDDTGMAPVPGEGMTVQRVVMAEEISAVDPAIVLAAPGPSLSGGAIEAMADPDQKKWFYSRLQERPTWTFFGLTEPKHGSDAMGLETTLTPSGDGHLELSGTKRYVGNAARADVGVVFARTRPGPLGVMAVMVDTADPGFKATPLPTLGMRGNQICAIEMDRVRIPPENVLGRHLPASRRGIWGALQSLSAFRPGMAGMAVGIARAAHDYLLRHRGELAAGGMERVREIGRRIEAGRALALHAARAADARSESAGYLASAAKYRTSRLAEDVTREAIALLGPGARLDHPDLDRYARDARAVEFMEGTRNVHRLNLFQGIVQRKLSG